MKNWVLLLCVLVLASSTTFAQRNSTSLGHSGFGDDSMRTLTLTGSVQTSDNQPLQNVRVEVRQSGTLQLLASGYTLPNGSFEFTNLPRGRYEVVAILGLDETREQVQLADIGNNLTLRLGNVPAATAGGRSTVSVAELKIPDNARDAYHKAEEAMRKRKLDDARKRVEQALRIAPKYAAALTLRGILNLSDNKLAEASSDCEQAIRLDPNYGMGYVVLGATLNVMQRFDDALRPLEHAIALMPNAWQAHFERAKALLGKGQYEESLRQINKAGELAPATYAPVHLVRAHALLGLKNYSQAITELEQYLGGAPNGTDAANARETLDQARAFAAKAAK